MKLPPIKVLYIDDDRGDVEVVRIALERACTEVNYDLIVGEHAEEAIDLIRNNEKFDLVILDLHIPPLNGVELLKHIRNNPATKDLPVIMVSGSDASSPLRAEAKKLGISGYFTKPFNFENFMTLFKKICHEWFIPIAQSKMA